MEKGQKRNLVGEKKGGRDQACRVIISAVPEEETTVFTDKIVYCYMLLKRKSSLCWIQDQGIRK